MKTKSSAQLTLHDRLSRLTIQQAEKRLGPEGKRRLVGSALSGKTCRVALRGLAPIRLD